MYLHSNSTQTLAYKKKIMKKKIPKKPPNFLPLFYATFQCGRYAVFKKNLKTFFDPEKVKKQALKVAHNRPNLFFSQSSPDHSPQPRIDFPYYKISGPDICSLICTCH
jgi:hypothetical protein